MALARYESVAVNLAGDVIPNATVEVRLDRPGRPVVPLWADREGTMALGNPITTDAEGGFGFHVVGGSYYIRVFTGPSQQPLQQRVRRYQAIGTAGERDVEDLASALEAGTATFPTVELLQAFTPAADEGVGGKVTTGESAGFYHYDPLLAEGVRWVFDRPLFDTLARMNVLGGDENDIEAEIASGVADSAVVMLWIEAPSTNTSPVRINEKPVLTIDEEELLPGQWLAGRTYWFSDEGSFYKLRTESDVSGLVAQAEAAAVAAGAAKDDAETAKTGAEAAAAEAEGYAAGLNIPAIVSGDGGKMLYVKDDETGFELEAAPMTSTDFTTVAAASVFAPVAAPEFIRTAGYFSAGDGGGALYKHVVAEPTHEGKFSITLADAVTVVWYEIASSPLPAGAFGAIGDGTVSQADMLTAVTNLWEAALELVRDMHFPAGLYEIGDANFPWRQSVVSGMLDCQNITLIADGPQTIFATNTPDGADVFQLNGIENFRVVGYPTLTATLTGLLNSGCNGCSITNGFDNLYLELTCTDLPSVDKGSFLDGGKALTIQPGSSSNPCGKLIAKVRAKGCSYAFGADLNLDTMSTKRMSVLVDLEAEDCYRAVVVSGTAATAALTEDFDLGITVKGHAINCQQDIVLSRAHGVRVDMTVVTTKTAAARRLDPNGVTWATSVTEVEALLAAYAQHSVVKIAGNKGECDYKARIGGTSAGSSGLSGFTLDCYFDLDIGGVAATGDIVAVNFGGAISNTSIFAISARTTNEVGVDTLLKNATYANLFDFAGTLRMVSPKVAEALIFAMSADGVTESGRIDLFATVTGLQGKATSVANAIVAGLFDQAGNMRFGIRNGAGLVTGSLSDAAASTGVHAGRLILYNTSNVAIGAISVNTV